MHGGVHAMAWIPALLPWPTSLKLHTIAGNILRFKYHLVVLLFYLQVLAFQDSYPALPLTLVVL
jgi:hypothetical protein